jgi:1,4-alpha-glucan branching enzyme
MHELDDTYEGYEWVDFTDSDNSVVTFMRKARNDPDGAETIVFALNFTPVVRHGYRVGFPGEGAYAEIFNTDAEIYGGSNVGNAGEVHSECLPWGVCSCSAAIELPPLAMVAFKRRS